MRIVILSYAAVRDDIALTLMERGHDVAFFGPGLVTAAAVREFITYDGCLLLGEAAELRAFADAFAALGKAGRCVLRLTSRWGAPAHGAAGGNRTIPPPRAAQGCVGAAWWLL